MSACARPLSDNDQLPSDKAFIADWQAILCSILMQRFRLLLLRLHSGKALGKLALPREAQNVNEIRRLKIHLGKNFIVVLQGFS